MTVSAPVPPVMVSTLETVTLLVPLASVSVSVPSDEVDGAGQRRAERDGVGLRAAGDGLGVRDRGGVGAGGRQGEAVGAGVEVDAAGERRRQGHHIGKGAAGDRLDVGEGDGIGDVAEGDGVGAAAAERRSRRC